MWPLWISAEQLLVQYFDVFILAKVFVSYVGSVQLVQDCAGSILGISSNELQVCASTKINMLGVPITLPYMALWASIILKLLFASYRLSNCIQSKAIT